MAGRIPWLLGHPPCDLRDDVHRSPSIDTTTLAIPRMQLFGSPARITIRGRTRAPVLDVATPPRGAGARGLGTHARDCWTCCARQHRHRGPQLFVRRPVPDPCRVRLVDARPTAPAAE